MKIRGGRRFGPTSALLGATEPVHQCDAGALRAPQTVALEHEHQILYRRGSSGRRPYFHIRLACSRTFTPGLVLVCGAKCPYLWRKLLGDSSRATFELPWPHPARRAAWVREICLKLWAKMPQPTHLPIPSSP